MNRILKQLLKIAREISALDEEGDGSGFQPYHDYKNAEQTRLDIAQKQGKKYILHHKEGNLWRIQACKDFRNPNGGVKKGKFGGLIESEKNLSHDGQCWIYDKASVKNNAMVYDNALIYGNALVYDNAKVYGNAKVGEARIHENAQVFGNAHVIECAEIHNNAKVYGNARVNGWSENIWGQCLQIKDSAQVYGNAKVCADATICDSAQVYDNAQILGHPIINTAKQELITM